jgi:DNA-binding transcriptional ArsR family regulator
MVQFQPAVLDRTFAALADPTRRAMLARLAEHGTQSAGDLARPFPVSLPAILKHLGVLAEAGLVRRQKVGRTVTCRFEPAPLRDAVGWIEKYEKFWNERLDRLAAFIEEDPSWPTGAPPGSRSRGTSRRRSKRSSAPGPKSKR